MRYLLIFLILLAVPAQAQIVSVKSGEHGPFTRLVLTFPKPVEWVLGRNSAGYGLRIAGPDLPYDLSSVYRLITKDRLRSIWVDPASGDLLLGLDCPCHAIPFELEANTLVIDIKDGPPPLNSSFELSMIDGTPLPPIQSTPTQRPRRSNRQELAYDWLATPAATPGSETPPAADTPTAVLDADLRLDAFRTMLIEEVGRGATEGVVEMERPSPPAAPTTNVSTQPLPDNARAALEELPGIEISADSTANPDLMVQGDTCPKVADLDFSRWSETEDAAFELARARAALLSEFDVPDPESVINAVNTHLFFGFGAEARVLMASFLPTGQTDSFRTGLSYLVDGEIPPANPFVDMQSCDSVALWALLAAPAGDAQPYVNGAAVSQTFLSLPKMLRVSLGPELVRRLLASGDRANAEVVRQSFERTVPQNDPALGLLAADQALQTGDPAAAEAALPTGADVAATGEAAMATLFTLVEARFQQRKPVEGKDILALEAFAFEHNGGPLRPQLDAALAHATALSGDFSAAFAHAAGNPALEQDVWMLLGELAPESQVLAFAVGLDPTQRATLPLATRSRIAERLVDAGLPNAATDWAQSSDLDPDLAARVALANGDARAALRLLSARLPDVDADLLAASYSALGDFNSAASTYQNAGNAAEAARVLRWAGSWPSPSTAPEDAGAIVAGLLTPSDAQTEAPPLQASQARLDQSTATRQAIADLLATTPTVAPP